MYEWGPEKYGIKVLINQPVPTDKRLWAVDVEDDENGGFVGIGIYDGTDCVRYFSKLDSELTDLLTRSKLIGQNFKSDLHKLRKWGIDLSAENVVFDTRLASYVRNSASQSHGLKEQAKEILGIEYPSYSEIVGKGRKKQTLDKQELDLVAAYNGMDCIATWRLAWYHIMTMSYTETQYLHTIEMPTMRILYEMEKKGIKVDVAYLSQLEQEFTQRVEHSHKVLEELGGEPFNPNSPIQVRRVLNKNGIKVNGTDKKKDLSYHIGRPLVDELLLYKKLQKLLGTYVSPLIELAKRDPGHRIYTEFKQTPVTGRLASANPNLQNISSHSEEGKKIRKAFIPEEGHVLAVSDYSQIDLRALAHYSEEPAWCHAFRTKGDPHESTAKAISGATGKTISRQQAKTLNFTMAYGSGPKNVAYEAKCAEKEAERLISAFWTGLPKFYGWRKDVFRAGRKRQHVQTLFARTIGIPGFSSEDDYESGAAEREAISYLGQGAPAEIIKKAMIRLYRRGYVPLLQEHDALVFEVPEHLVAETIQAVEYEMTNAVVLKVPLEVKAKVGKSWLAAKG